MRIPVNGLHLNIEQRTGPGHPLVLLHGFTGSALSWFDLMAELDSNYHLIAVDLLGHGESDAPNNAHRYAMPQAVADLRALFDHLGLSSVDLLGYSMGGRVALHYAIAHPDQLHSLILESTSPGVEDPLEQSNRRKADHELASQLEREGIHPFVNRWEKQTLFASQSRLSFETRLALRRQRLSSRPEGLSGSLVGAGVASHPPLFDQLPTIEVPTLVIAGELDSRYCDLAVRMHSLLPNSSLVLVPDAGHTVHLEHPAPFAQALGHFLKTHDSQLITHNYN